MAPNHSGRGTIVFSVVGRTHYGFDVFSVPAPHSTSPIAETQLTDGVSVNLNGSFTSDGKLAYISERSGSARIYINDAQGAMEVEPLKGLLLHEGHDVFYDRPILNNDRLYFVSTQEKRRHTRQSWAAVYVTLLQTGNMSRLTPLGMCDLSPALSPSGKWMAVASYEGKEWQGEIEDLSTAIYVFNALDGTDRRMVVKHGGWPTWADDRTLFFHRRAEDGWWSVYKVTVPDSLGDPLEGERVTPPCVHAFTPAASRNGEWIVVATRRPQSEWRHIELFHPASGEFSEFTVKLNPEKHHYNPFVSNDSHMIGYHRCRDVVPTETAGPGHLSPFCVPRLEAMKCPVADLGLVRIDGSFPSVSPCGKYITCNHLGVGGSGSLTVMRSDGSKAWSISKENVFYTVWDPCSEGVIYCNAGKIFQPSAAEVHIAAIHLSLDSLTDDAEEVVSNIRLLTKPGTANNAFPSPSPDGKKLVFRSGRDGHKNLYIMDAIDGEEKGIRRLTSGDWTDTMPNWSPDGQWIAFSSDREGVSDGCFGLYMIHPDGSGLHRVSLEGSNEAEGQHVYGRINHVEFSPDGQSIVFTADAAGLSAEPISLPNQFQPYGEIFVSKPDGSSLVRLTHNAYEDGTPTWTPVTITLPKHYPAGGGPPIVASAGAVPLRGDFSEPRWLARLTEEMQRACC